MKYPKPARKRNAMSHANDGEKADAAPDAVFTHNDTMRHARRPILSATVPHIQPPNIIPTNIMAPNHPYCYHY